jgi:DNA-binding response OmpR family regulator
MKKILVVDDDKDLLTALKSVFTRQGYEVVVTLSCHEGFNIYQVFKPDMIFLDINVGTEDGRGMCKKIKMQAEQEQIVIILMSANSEALKLYKNYRADAILRKPFSMAALSETLKNYLVKS